jgi:hypothetical protein
VNAVVDLHATLEILAILAILENRKSLFSSILGFSGHPHTVEVTGSNPVPPNRKTDPNRFCRTDFRYLPSVGSAAH